MGEITPITFKNFKWLNEPKKWSLEGDVLNVTTDSETDFWRETWYNFTFNTGHVFGYEIEKDFTIVVGVEADFTTLYDQAGLMLYVDERHWLKAGIEYNDGQPMFSTVLTNETSDWATALFPGVGTPIRCWLKLSKVGGSVCVKYSTDRKSWSLLRLAPFPVARRYFVGPVCCTPKRAGLQVRFTDLEICDPPKDALHD